MQGGNSWHKCLDETRACHCTRRFTRVQLPNPSEMSSKARDYKLTYTTDKVFEEFFTGPRIDVDHSGQLIVSSCTSSVKFPDIHSAKLLHEIKLTNDNDEESGEYIVTFTFMANRLVVAYNSGLLRHFSIDINVRDVDENVPSRLGVESQLLRTWKSLHVGPIATIQFDTTDTLIATGGSDSSVKIWDIVNNYCTHNLKEAKGVVSTLAFAPNYTSENYHLFGSGDDYVIHVWNLITSKYVTSMHGHSSKITDIVFAQDGLKVISSSRDKLIIVWNGVSFEKERTIAVFESIETMCLLPRKSLTVVKTKGHQAELVLVTAGESGLLKIWDYTTGNLLYTQAHSLIRVSESKSAEHSNDQQEADSQYNLVNQLIFHAQLGQLVAVSFDKDIIFHDVANLSPLRQLVGQNDEILDIKLVGQEQKHIAVAANSPKIKVFELATSSCFILLGHADIVLALAVFQQDPLLMVSAAKDNSVRVWQFNSTCTAAICLYLGTGHTHSVTSIATSMIDQQSKADLFFLSGSEDTTLKFWKVPKQASSFEENRQDNTFPSTLVSKFTQSCHEKAINSIDVSPNNQLVATGSQDKTAKLWLLPNLKLVGVFRGHKKGIWHVQFSPVDQVLATCSADSTIKIWSIENYSCLKTFQGHTSSVLNAAFIDQGMQFLSSASDGNLKIWNLKSNECTATFDAHEGKVWALAISNDEEMLVTGSDDSKIAVWKNITTEVKEKEAIKAEESIQSEQTMQNLLHTKSWHKALKMAIRLEHPLRCLNILKEILLQVGSTDALVAQLTKLRQDQLLTLLEYSVHWNSNSKHYVVAQCVIQAVLQQITPEELMQLAEFRGKVEKLLPYCERHMARVQRLKQYVFFADFVFEQMKLPDSEA